VIIITHRGLEPSNQTFAEGSLEALSHQTKRGFGIEFDLNLSKDGLVAWHGKSLKAASGKELTLSEHTTTDLQENRLYRLPGKIGTIDQILSIVAESKVEINALHLKWNFQRKEIIDLLITALKANCEAARKIMVFDLLSITSAYMKKKVPFIQTAPSVAHPYDILRYNSYVGNTLITKESAIREKNQGQFTWVWLDEWDLQDEEGSKQLYTPETFAKLKEAGYRISIVSPELHRTSPGILGGEVHEDANTKERLFSRMRTIISYKPDAICTDYPLECLEMLSE